MSSPKIIQKQNYKRSLWKNGLGYTDEIAIFPPEANLAKGDFLYRISSARIEKAAPFSIFPDHDRVLLVLKGSGIRLTHVFEEGAEDTVDLPPLEPYEFPGDVPSRCELTSGPITDFSLFIKKGHIEPMVLVVDIEKGESFSWSTEGRWNFAYAIHGDFEVDGLSWHEGDTLAVEFAAAQPDGPTLELRTGSSHAKLLLVSLG
jgi:environmental stress-induced protein Ves